MLGVEKRIYTAEQRAEFVQLCLHTKLSYSQIAQRMGLTRGAVSGLVHRMKLREQRPIEVRERNQPVKRSAHSVVVAGYKPSKMKLQPLPPPEKLPPEPPPPAILEMSPGATIAELTDKNCHWPMGDPCEEGFRFCGGEAVPELPYCRYHAKIAYVEPKVRTGDCGQWRLR